MSSLFEREMEIGRFKHFDLSSVIALNSHFSFTVDDCVNGYEVDINTPDRIGHNLINFVQIILGTYLDCPQIQVKLLTLKLKANALLIR